MAVRFNEETCRARLQEGVRQLGVTMAEEQARLLLQFLRLLVKWNSAYNLTAVRDPLEMVGRHLLDSLAVLPHLSGKRCLDMGTGPGLPGIPLAVMRPEMEFVLLDGNGKKIRFVRQAVLELGLRNVQPVHGRLESYRPERGFDTLIARAFTALPAMLDMTEGLRGKRTVLLAMKGRLPVEELSSFDAWTDYQVIRLKVAFEARESCIIRFPAVGRMPPNGLRSGA
jgi:16S rRNA (guanine527-N7)-methyltransferase